MATNLANRGINIGQHNACILRVAALDADCQPSQGVNGGIVSTGLVTMTATPEIEEGTVIEPKTGCGRIAYTIEDEDKVKKYNLQGEIIFFDFELMQLMFGGSLILGAGGGDFAGEVIGHAKPGPSAANRNGTYLEVITLSAAEGGGDCIAVSTDRPYAFGHIFPKTKLYPGERVFENDAARVTFTGKSNPNPSLYNGPWNDYPGAGVIPMTTPYLEVGYTQAQYNAIAAVAAPGYLNLPAAS